MWVENVNRAQKSTSKPLSSLKITFKRPNLPAQAFFCSFDKIHVDGKRKSYFQIRLDFCTCRKNRILTRYKIQYIGKCKSRPKIALKTSFNAQISFQTSKSTSELKNFVSNAQIDFIDEKFRFKRPNRLQSRKISFQTPKSTSNAQNLVQTKNFLLKSVQMRFISGS